MPELSAEDVRQAMDLAESEWGPESAHEIFDSWKLDQLASLWAKVEGVPVTDAVRERVESICRGDDAVRMVLGLYAESRREQRQAVNDDRFPDPDTWKRFLGMVEKGRKSTTGLSTQYFEAFSDTSDGFVDRRPLFEADLHNFPALNFNKVTSLTCLSRLWCSLLGGDLNNLSSGEKISVEDRSSGKIIGSFLVSELLKEHKPMSAIIVPKAPIYVRHENRPGNGPPIRVMIAGWRVVEAL